MGMVEVMTTRPDDNDNDNDNEPDPSAVSSRASGRPPEEDSSEDPQRQAEVILEDSEDRTSQGADKSTPTSTRS
jgi:hypothetical protein